MKRPDLAALAFCALVVTGVVVLAALHVAVPDFLPAVGMFVAGVGGGAALNSATTTTTTAPAAAPADVPAAAPAIPAQQIAPATDPASTAVFARIATHQ